MSTIAAPPASQRTPVWVQLIAVLFAIPTVVFTIVGAVLAAGAIDGVTADSRTHRAAALGPGETVTVNLEDSGATIQAGPDGAVTMDDRLSVHAPTRDLARRILERSGGGTLTSGGDGVVVTVPPTPNGLATSVNREVTVRVPTTARLIVRATTGAARVIGLAGDLDLSTTSGAFDLEDVVVTGTAQVRAVNGAINFQGRVAGGTLDLRAEHGAINVSLPGNTSASYALHSGYGAINVSRLDGHDSSGGGRDQTLSGKLGTGSGGSIVAETGAGAINLDARG